MYICSQYHKTMPLKIIDNIYKSDLDISLSKLDPLDSLAASGVATTYAYMPEHTHHLGERKNLSKKIKKIKNKIKKNASIKVHT